MKKKGIYIFFCLCLELGFSCFAEDLSISDNLNKTQPSDSSTEFLETKLEEELFVQNENAFVEQTAITDAEEQKLFSDEFNFEENSFQYKELELEGAQHQLTKKIREQFLTERGQKIIIASLKASELYLPYIRQKLEEKNLPMILQYLPIVESNFVPQAVSKTGATGIWQFMENSMAPFLKKDPWFDERRDPWLSTDAALAKLSENFKMFGDWEIAIAAYNCGSGAMGRVTKKNPDKDFWYLAENGFLKNQTAQYVPKLLAIADIIENAEYYDVPAVAFALAEISDEVKDFDYVKTTGMLSFNQISKVTGIDKNIIYQLNPALFRNCTPARQVYNLRLPKGSGENAELALKNAGIASDAVIYTVEKGDSLWAISRRYGISVEDLCVVNGIKENGILSIGKKLIVPIFK